MWLKLDTSVEDKKKLLVQRTELTLSVIADWLCIGRPSCLVAFGRDFLNRGPFFLHHLVDITDLLEHPYQEGYIVIATTTSPIGLSQIADASLQDSHSATGPLNEPWKNLGTLD